MRNASECGMRNAECGMKNQTPATVRTADRSFIPHSAFRIPQWEGATMSNAMRCCMRGALLLLAGAALPCAAQAQEIQWRYDYKKAREESVEKGLPIVIDFGTESCFWCKQLDARTFRDAAVASLMNERCI